MNKTIDKLNIIQLYDIYKALLTDKQVEMLKLFYDCDLSLGEIAQQYGITRQGVRDFISSAEQLLLVYESKLHLLDKRIKIQQCIDSAKLTADDDTIRHLENIERIIC
ncbi:MAG: sigma factor-like helix-turn-helix DNA-binding protein [Clostridia bacterium]|nr:sigma factor-like helix-turn-helix DNA-binding protein [Clostridia bacterium]